MSFTRRNLIAGSAAIGAAAASGFPLREAGAAAPMSGKQAPGFYRHKIGDYEVTIINDGSAEFPIAAIRAPAEEINKALEAQFMPTGKLVAPFNITLVNTGSKLVLIDTGNGVNPQRPTAGLASANLAAAGVEPKSIDTVIISHFHGDHIGGLVNPQGQAVYSSAEIMVPAKEWAFWMDEGNMSRATDAQKPAFNNVRRIFGAYNNKVTQYENGKEVAPGITAMDTPGHTPGHTSFTVASGNGKLMVQGDVTAVVSVLITQRPEWAIGGDANPQQAQETRRKLYDMLAAERMLMTGYHFPFPAVGYIEKTGNGYRYIPAPWNPVV
jgi:glyoxylase-like metal-dependent hydrolase (beta-lactamase superfamily II)